MKIVIFTTAYFPMIGGAEVAIKEVTDRLRDIEFELFCAKMRSDTAKQERIGNVTVHRVGFGRNIDKYLLPLLGPVLARFRVKESDASVWSVMASYGGFAGLYYSWLRPKAKFILTLQEGDPVERYQKHAGPFNALRKRIFSSADRVHAISRFLAEWGKEMGAKQAPQVIPNGVDVLRFSERISAEERVRMRRDLGFGESDIVLVTASRLSHKNAVDDVIRALPELDSRYKFLILGTGEDEAMLRSLVSDLGLSNRVNFFGNVAHVDLPKYLQSSEIFVRPSRSEGLGNAFLEAMAAGIPVIGTLVGGIPDFLLDGETGVACEVDRPGSIADAARKLEDAALREKIVEQAKKLVRQKYDWDSIADQMKKVLCEF